MSVQLILASASPRRLELLQQLGYEPRCVAVDVDEYPLAGEAPTELVQRLAIAKAECYLQRAGDGSSAHVFSAQIVLGADTVIDLDGEILGKPRDREDALQMLQSLSDREHAVVSGVCVLRASGPGLGSLLQREAVTVRTAVRFGPLSPEQAACYWETGEPAGKAGAYAIQGAGAQFVAHLSGSYSNVVGLPLYETHGLLRRAGLAAGHTM